MIAGDSLAVADIRVTVRPKSVSAFWPMKCLCQIPPLVVVCLHTTSSSLGHRLHTTH